jgi:hypothetical protein
MFGSPTSVFPGLAPTAVSWTSKHLEVWALTRDTTHSVYRKWQNESYPDGYPKGTEMELAGDGVPINATKTPSIALVKRTEGRTAENYRVDVHVVSPGGQGTLTWHSPSQRLRPAVPRTPWFVFESLKSIQVQSAIVSVGYAKEGDKMTSMFLSSSGNKTAVWYTHLRGYDTWDPPGLIKGPDLYGVRSSSFHVTLSASYKEHELTNDLEWAVGYAGSSSMERRSLATRRYRSIYG